LLNSLLIITIDLLKPLFILFALLLTMSGLYAQNEYGCGIVHFKTLTYISKKDSVTDSDLNAAVQCVKTLEERRCEDYTGKKNGVEYVIATCTSLFGDICLKKNDFKAVDAYIKYMNREHGSAEEQISFSLEKLFVQRPEDVLSLIGYNKDMLNQLEWGFVNNHAHLTTKNYRKVFYSVNSELKIIYLKHKKAIDYLLNAIDLELKV
jgi:hypothetical protein